MSSSVSPAEAPLRLVRRTPELAGMVDEIIGYRENGLGIDDAIEMAALVVPFIISFGDSFAIGLGKPPGADDRFGSFASGLFAGPVVISSSGHSECIQVNFTPLGAWRFFGMPMDELADRMVPLDDLGDPEFGTLRQRLWEEPDWEQRLSVTQGFVTQRLRRSPSADPALGWAYNHLLANAGDVPIAELAGKLDWSRKHLVHRFRTQLGLPPKAIARMIRFHAALAMAGSQDNPGWADVAAACGYADQAHFTRDFREFSGTSPTRWRAGTA